MSNGYQIRSVKSLKKILPKKSGRNNSGKITSRHSGGRHKRFYRYIDFKRDKLDISGKVISYEYDPNRNVDIALVQYTDGEKRFILKPTGLSIGDSVLAAEEVEAKAGNSTRLKSLPIGTVVHNIELTPGKGGQLAKAAGSMATIISQEEGFAHIKLPSGEVRKINKECRATVGQLSNLDWKSRVLGKAGTSRRMGRRPKVRGTAQHPGSHPHGGGEGRSGEGMHPKTPWGKSARGTRTRKRGKHSDKLIIKRRKK